MKTTVKKKTKTTLNGATSIKKVNYIIDPETGRKVHKRWIFLKNLWATNSGIEIKDMKAVLK